MSIEIGYAFATAVRRTSSATTRIAPDFVSNPNWRRTAFVELPASCTRWKPMTSAPTRPASTCLRHGSCANRPYAGKGNVVGVADHHIRSQRPQQPRDELELVVLNPHHRAGSGGGCRGGNRSLTRT